MVGDIRLCGIKQNQTLTSDRVASRNYGVNYVIEEGCELIGVCKGLTQIAKERSLVYIFQTLCQQEKHRNIENRRRKEIVAKYKENRRDPDAMNNLLARPSHEQVLYEASRIHCECIRCAMRRENDFMSKKCALEELYDKHNLQHHKNHRCIYLPKFHPEFNPIERCWSRMKWYIRKYSDGTLTTLRRLLVESYDGTLTTLRRLLVESYDKIRIYLIG